MFSVQNLALAAGAFFLLGPAIRRRLTPESVQPSAPPASPSNDERTADKSSETQGPPSTNQLSRGAHNPSIQDVLVIKALFFKALHIPPELTNVILDDAEYWPRSHIFVNYQADRDMPLQVVGGGHNGPENMFLLRTPPVGFVPSSTHAEVGGPAFAAPRPLPHTRAVDVEVLQAATGAPNPPTAHPVRKIVFTITAADQGWATGRPRNLQNSYEQSYTWFEAGLERFEGKENLEREDSDQISEQQQQSPAFKDAASSRSSPVSLDLDRLRTVLPPVIPVLQSQPGLRFDHTLLPHPETLVQMNRAARRDALTHTVEWHYRENQGNGAYTSADLSSMGRGSRPAMGAQFVRDLRLGDVVTLWAKARFGGWVNTVYGVGVDVYCAV